MPHPDFQPTLVGPNVTVRPLFTSDWPEMFAAASDPEVWRLHPASDRYTEPAFRKFFDGGIDSKKAFAFIDRARNRVIGSSRYHDYKPDESEVEIGWTFLARSHWGGVTNREVKRLMLDHAFTFVDTVVFWVGEKNFRSQGAMRKIGGVLRAGFFERPVSDGTRYVIFEITKARYQDGGRKLVA